jgi:D-glycero-alpha-D-manno-heptose-7-phosphate kinase
LADLKQQARQMHRVLAEGLDPEAFGRLLDRGWRTKRLLASTISSPRIDEWYERAVAAGAWGGKLCGAGGGGFFLFVVPPARQQAVRAEMAELKELSVRAEPQGSRVLMPHVE